MPSMVKTGVPSDSCQRFWRERIFGAEASKTFLAEAWRLFGVRERSLWIIKSEAAEVEAAVEVNDIARAERKVASADGSGSEADIFRLAPAVLRDETFRNKFIIFFFDPSGHIGGHDSGAQFDDLDAMGGKAGGPELGGHGEAGFGDAVFATVDGSGVGGEGGDEEKFIATGKKGLTGVGEPVAGGELGEEVGAFEVHGQDLVKDFFFGFGDVGAFAGGDAGVVDEAVEASAAFEDALEEVGAVLGGGELGGNGEKLLVFGFGDGLASGDGCLRGWAVGGVVNGEIVAFRR